ncbi:tRNA uridine-5-carboxymethylaminomethyl(34) synthesis GTPase MnmE [Namhaeicola litoreus]|uniref:tRNA modification GTPase MnmE n=1 Tax=Namhaeicola litoreus TaxID=1052145 RepID=A0ABW3Y2M4_9FLAO
MTNNDPIIALATPSGVGAIAVIRISGNESIRLVSPFFKSKSGKILLDQKSHTLHLGHIYDGERILDEVLISVFKNPYSYTGEDVVEISCHGSVYIQQEIIQLFIKNGIRHASPGEFTLRAFLNGKMDLSQAEAVADLIASDSSTSHQIAIQQMRGGFSNEIEELRTQLLNFASLIELELDFSEEDVEFADRREFKALIQKINSVLKRLIDSFALGNVIKNGIPVAIVGEPNAGKSTLLNALLNEEKAIVSNIAGTTRDAIEDEIVIGGVTFRFIDTAGIRETKDEIETVGIQKTFQKIEQAQLVIYLIDGTTLKSESQLEKHLSEIKRIEERSTQKKILVLLNKTDQISEKKIKEILHFLNKNITEEVLSISAKDKTGLENLTAHLQNLLNKGALSNNQTIVSNARHFDALHNALKSTKDIVSGLDKGISSDLIAIDIRQALFHLGEITGQITTDDLLGNIFANFCIGK